MCGDEYQNGTFIWKYKHTKEVVDYTKKIIDMLEMSDRKKDLALTIAIFHDLGRFIQLKAYSAYNDSTTKFNHAKESVEILIETKWFERNNVNERDKDIICFAIENHNKKTLDDINKTDKEKLEFAKIIRDADKIANIYRINFINYVKQPVNRDALEELFSQTLVSYKNMTNSIDQILTCFSYIYDLAYNESVKIIIREHLLEPLVEKIKLFSDISDEDYQKIINIIEKFKFQS